MRKKSNSWYVIILVMKPVFYLLLLGILILTATGCTPVKTPTPAPMPAASQPDATPTRLLNVEMPTNTAQLPAESTPMTAQNTPVPTAEAAEITPIPEVQPVSRSLAPGEWQTLPVIPSISPRTIEIYQKGVVLGNDPRAFSKIGDCGSTPAWFLGDFDRGERWYNLGGYTNLLPVIQEFQGSFSRTSLAARSGFNVSSIFAPLWADPQLCEANESPVDCEYRLHKPSFAFIMLGSNDVYHPEEFEPGMRALIEFFIDRGVVPILSTKADNLEGDGSLNATIARLALEYDVPLINYWRALQALPDQGLQKDQVHITWGSNRFDDPQAMSKGWPIRNLTALQALDAVWRTVTGQSSSQ